VSTLLGQARQQARDGQLEQASASLERALRIEPSNPWVWHQLALVRLFQNQEEQAAQMATRSNTFARDRDLQARNWRVIAQARERQGDLEGAGEAAGHAQRLGGG
jgi:predicted Zn-dependent protease